jgi:diguanylate cyclase (GGDEF)-like protein
VIANHKRGGVHLCWVLAAWFAAPMAGAQTGYSTAQASIERAVHYDPAKALSSAQTKLADLKSPSETQVLLPLRQIAAAQDELELADDALASSAAALATARRLGDTQAAAQMLLVQANALAIHRRQSQAAEAFKESLALSEGLVDTAPLVRALVAQSWQRYGAGYMAEAAELLGRAHETAQRSGDSFGVALALSGMGGQGLSSRASASERRVALEQLEAALKSIDTQVYRSFAMGVHHNIGVARQRLGDPDGARAAFERATQLANQLGNRRTYAANKLELATLELSQQHFLAAQSHLKDAEPWVESLGGASMQFTLHVVGASVEARAGRLPEAQRHLVSARALIGEEKNSPARARYLMASADVQEKSRQYKAAVESLRELLRVEAAMGARANDERAVEMRTLFKVAEKAHENRVLAERERATNFKYGMVLLALISSLLFLGLAGLVLRTQIRKRRYYSDIAFKDELTGLPNRRSILRRGQLEVEMARLSKGSVFVAIADIDHFKRINDTQGHDAGDAALRAFSQALQGVLRDSDALGRYGGEEFLLLIRQGTSAGVTALFERMQEAVRAIDLSAIGLDKPITFSLGVAQVAPTSDLVAAIKRADEALYRAKADGRDCCRFA